MQAERDAALAARMTVQAEHDAALAAQAVARAERDAAVATQESMQAERDATRIEHEQAAARLAAEGEVARLAAATHQARADQLARAMMRAFALARQIGHGGFSEEPLVVGPAIAAIESTLKNLFEPNVGFATLIGTDRAEVAIERHQLEHVIVTLAANRRAAMADGGQVSLEVAEVDIDEACARQNLMAPGPYLLVALHAKGLNANSGIADGLFGVPASAHLWAGAGPGMVGVFDLVAQSGGYLWARKEGIDAVAFEVYLPRVGTPSGTGEERGR
jgi:hypothetical protein